MALVHDWKKFGMKNNTPFSAQQWEKFRGTSLPDFGQSFTTMMYENLLDEMLINKDMYIITDTKSTDFSKDETKQAGDASDRLPEYYPGLFMRFSRILLPAGLPQKSCRFRFH